MDRDTAVLVRRLHARLERLEQVAEMQRLERHAELGAMSELERRNACSLSAVYDMLRRHDVSTLFQEGGVNYGVAGWKLKKNAELDDSYGTARVNRLMGVGFSQGIRHEFNVVKYDYGNHMLVIDVTDGYKQVIARNSNDVLSVLDAWYPGGTVRAGPRG